MKKLILLAVFVLSGLVVHGQITVDSSYADPGSLLNLVGSGVLNAGGDSKKQAYIKIDNVIDTLQYFYVVDTLTTTNAVDSTKVSAALGMGADDAAAVGTRWYIKDAQGTGKIFFVFSDGTEWYVDSLTAL